MGLVNARNLRRAKRLLDQNRHRIGDVVEQAGTQLDKVSNGKTASVTAKASDAAKKYSAGAASTPATVSSPDGPQTHDPAEVEEAKLRQAQATTTAANAVSGAANALTNLMNKAAARVETTSSKPEPPASD